MCKKKDPPGKRRDQRCSELFGNEIDDRDLRKHASTFEPRMDPLSPRRRKLKNLQGGTVPETNALDLDTVEAYGTYRANQLPFEERNSGKLDRKADPVVRRQQDLESHIFDTGLIVDQNVTKKTWTESKITPNCFNWYNSDPIVRPPAADQPGVTHQDRAYFEKTSNLFDHKTAPAPTAKQLRDDHVAYMEEEQEASNKRKANVYYSDLFDRPTPGLENTNNLGQYHPKHYANDDSHIIINQEWTDAKTEIMRQKRSGATLSAGARKFEELHQTNIPDSPKRHKMEDRQMLEPIETDTSQKVRRAAPGELGMHVHQKHMKSSLVREEFYDRAEATKAWEVAEINLSRVPVDADERSVKDQCKGFECQVVKVHLDVDPISNMCKGRAKLVLRYNPESNDLSGLISKIQALGWQVAFLGE